MTPKKPLSAFGHIPHYSLIFVRALRTPLLIFFALAGNFLMFACAFVFYSFESELNDQVNHLFDAVWWAFCTVSTVGFGDITPVTTEGRVVGIFLMITGITFFVGFTAVLVSVISSLSAKDIVKSEEITYEGYQEVLKELKEISTRLQSLERK